MDSTFLDIAAKALRTAPGNLKEDSTAGTIPEWDSLTHWALIGQLEEAYDIEFTMDEATEFKNLGDIYRILMEKLS